MTPPPSLSEREHATSIVQGLGCGNHFGEREAHGIRQALGEAKVKQHRDPVVVLVLNRSQWLCRKACPRRRWLGLQAMVLRFLQLRALDDHNVAWVGIAIEEAVDIDLVGVSAANVIHKAQLVHPQPVKRIHI